MINVSSAFKENIKKTVRQIGGYAELVVDGGYFVRGENFPNINVTSTKEAEEITMGYLNSVIDDNPTMYKYASFETNRLLLDGSFILPSKVFFNKNTGYISDTIGSGNITISGNYDDMTTIMKGERRLTIYFEEGYAPTFNFYATAKYDNGQTASISKTITNTESIVTIGADVPEKIAVGLGYTYFDCYTDIGIYISSWSEPNRRVRIRQVNIGETQVLEKNDIIEINIDEETKFDNTDTPNNECNVLLNNYSRKFNLLDNNSVLNRLTKKSAIHLFIGASLNGGAIDYVNMGTYHFSSYQENQDKTITLYGAGVKELYGEKPNKLLSVGVPEETVSEFLSSININSNVGYDGTIQLRRTNTETLRQQLQAIAIFSNSYIKELREFDSGLYNVLSLNKMTNIPVDRLSLQEQIKEPQITRNNKTSSLKINATQIGTLDNNEKILLEDTLTIDENGASLIQLSSSNPINLSSIKVYLKDEDDTETLLSSNYYIYNSYFTPQIYVYNLTNSQYIGIKIVGKEYNQTRIENKVLSNNEGSELEYNNEYIYDKYNRDRVSRYFFNNEKDYQFKIDFNGDPSLEVGDTITFETVDGDMIGNIEKINIKFNGGLQETIEGVCNSVL